ncbi:MAG: enoyl-CoA hydratase/isomerase family protein [Betaproteobacteria bacterium]|nr:MAG: enoyl-CoA hydratase/isomerase family protein [Betaproteobacteria bacterium]
MYRTLSLRFSGAVASLALNRAASRNAMSTELMQEMIACAGELAARDDIDVVIVTGAGKCFSAGADLKDPQRWSNDLVSLTQRRAVAELGLRMARAWEDLPQITIAAIEGYAIGGGLALAVALDWRVAARNAFVSLPEISLGIPLTWGTIPRLVNLVGPARAKRLTILCQRVAAPAALRMGLIDELCAPRKAHAAARALAARVLAMPRHAVRMSKEACNAYANRGAQATSFMAHDQLLLAAASAESRAARDAFLKRRPVATRARSRAQPGRRDSVRRRPGRAPR